MRNVALTGNIASGKSTVGRLWREAGVPVVSADELAREAVRPGSSGLDEVRAAFGDEVLRPDGSFDRDRMRRRVFRDDDARRRLEKILHPHIERLREDWIRDRRTEGCALVVSEIPLLFEVGLQDAFDEVVLVDAPLETRIDRVVEHRNLTRDEARGMAAAQMDPARKRERAHLVIENSGSLEDLEREAHQVLGGLRDRAGVEKMRIDLHLHTRGSYDCLSDPEAVLERARERGVSRIAITDHDRLEVAAAMAAAHPDEVIAGEEVRTAEGVDLIGLYLESEIPGGTPARETCRRIHSQGGLAYLPHPYARGKGGGGRLAEVLAPWVDLVETFNGRLHPASRNHPAEELARRHGRLRGAGSDAHTLAEAGRCYVEAHRHPNRPEALRAALYTASVHGREASRLVHLASTWAKLRKKLP